MMSPMMGGGRGSLGGGGPMNAPYAGGMGGRSGLGSKPPTKMMRMDDSGMLFVSVIMMICHSIHK